MKITYDPAADAAYIYFREGGTFGVRSSETVVCDLERGRGTAQFDFDADGRLIGVEILNAHQILPPELVEAATTG